MDQLNALIEKLQQANLMLRHQFELAEAQLPLINQQVERLASLSLGDAIVLGAILYDQVIRAGCTRGPAHSRRHWSRRLGYATVPQEEFRELLAGDALSFNGISRSRSKSRMASF